MMGFMNNDALILTIESGFAHYWSRSRKKIWKKGETSGMYQSVKDLRIDDDQDAIWMQVELAASTSCHVGYKSCFYRAIPIGKGPVELQFKETEKVFDPETKYGDLPNPTIITWHFLKRIFSLSNFKKTSMLVLSPISIASLIKLL